MTGTIQNDLSVIPPLPVELTDLIIDCLADHRRALKTCTLVCRTWSPRAQSHLFQRMNWTIDFDIRRARDPMATFAKSPVRKYVQHLSVRLSHVSPLWNLGAVERFLSLFTYTSSLHLLAGGSFIRVPRILIRALAAAFPGLQELKLGAVLMFNYTSDLIELVCAFKGLRIFTWEGAVEPFYRDAQEMDTTEPLTRLQVLSLRRSSALLVGVYEDLLGEDGFARLTSLELHGPDHSHLNGYLAKGPLLSLKRLSLYIDRDSDVLLDLSNCLSLTSLKLTTFELGVPHSLRWAASTLSTLPPSSPLQNLELNVGIDSIEDDTLRPLRGVLVFAHLPTLVLSVTFREESDWVELQPHQMFQADTTFLQFFSSINERLRVTIEDGCPEIC